MRSTLLTASLLMVSEIIHSQPGSVRDTIIKITAGSFLQIDNKNFFIRNDTSIKMPSSLINVSATGDNRTIAFYDSLKSKAAKSRFTRILYNLVIVSPDPVNPQKITQKSDENFIRYSGFKIRTITITQTGVFGGNIYNPAAFNPNRLEKFLNSTHINTNEKVLRRYLLFREGDTISPLVITDNERILRQLPYIDDARIIIAPVSENEADIIIITKDIYSLGGDFTYRAPNKGSVWIYDNNILGMGHEMKIEIPYSSTSSDSPGLGINYRINNIAKSFINLGLRYYDGLGKNTYGFNFNRPLLSSETKHAFGIDIYKTVTTHDLDTLPIPEPLKYTFQDYWFLRSFMVDRRSVSRIIGGIRYINNNVYQKPDISPDIYYSLQRYRLYLASLSFSMQKYYKTSFIYSYGRTEDIPYGTLIRITSGIEDNEFKKRIYLGTDASIGISAWNLGYFYLSAAAGTFFNEGKTEQGLFSYSMKYLSNLIIAGRQMIRNFVHLNYTSGIDRYRDEYLKILKEDAFSSFSNDSLRGTKRFNIGIESVIFNPVNFYGFRFAFFTFADIIAMGGTRINSDNRLMLGGLGLGLRIRNDNLVFRTFQIRLGYFPYLPAYSEVNTITISGEQLLRPGNFDPGPPGLIPYR
ncbi:MAG: hypothetical protein ACUVTX_02640 [Bacteroidales bacterium]